MLCRYAASDVVITDDRSQPPLLLNADSRYRDRDGDQLTTDH
jgi:hypothetical protein